MSTFEKARTAWREAVHVRELTFAARHRAEIALHEAEEALADARAAVTEARTIMDEAERVKYPFRDEEQKIRKEEV